MRWDARTPEELDALLEDTFVLRDEAAVVRLFDDGAVLVTDGPDRQVRGAPQVGECIVALWGHGHTFVASPRPVIQVRDTALVLAGRGASVMRRGADGVWRYVICHLPLTNTEEVPP